MLDEFFGGRCSSRSLFVCPKDGLSLLSQSLCSLSPPTFLTAVQSASKLANKIRDDRGFSFWRAEGRALPRDRPLPNSSMEALERHRLGILPLRSYSSSLPSSNSAGGAIARTGEAQAWRRIVWTFRFAAGTFEASKPIDHTPTDGGRLTQHIVPKPKSQRLFI